MLSQALIFLFETAFNLLVLAALLRFFMQVFRAPFRNPVAQFVVALTDFGVKPLRRIIPGFGGVDVASLVFAWLAEIVLLLIVFAIRYQAVPDGAAVPALLTLSLIALLRLTIYLLIGVVLVQAILSWVSPYHPMMPLFDTLTRPFLRPLRRVVPLVGGVDLSPLVLLVICQLILMLPIAWLELEAVRLFQARATG
ncbi:MAG: YggT family protein [Betaproteobacteria bacterium]|nr:YggT family protein [Betaproteobacteria bacterium]